MKSWIIAIGACLFSVFAAQAQAILDLPELNPQLAQYEKRVIAKAAADRRSPIDLFKQVRDAMVQGRPAVALDALEVLAGRNNGRGEGGSRTWLRLALALQTQSVSSPSDEPPAAAVAAAYGAYRRAVDDGDRIEALSLLGSLLMRSARIKETDDPQQPPVEPQSKDGQVDNFELARRLAYQVFTKLGELVPGGKYEAQKARTEPGQFRLARVTYPAPPRPTAYKDDSRCEGLPKRKKDGDATTRASDDRLFASEDAECDDNPAGHTCLVFSRALDTRVDEVMKNIVVERTSGRREVVNVPPAAVRAKSVCWANLSFGTTYRFTLKNTLRSADGARIAGPLTAVLEMPKRWGSLGFKRGAYVLPATGAPRFVLKTVNVGRANLMLRRIGDRNLIREIVAEHIVGGVAQKDSCYLLNDISEQIADGTLELTGAATEERDYVVPVGRILQTRREWLPTYARGVEGKFEEVDANSKLTLKLKLQGDRVAAETASAAQAGVFVLFGKVNDDDSQPDDTEPDSQCPKGMASQWFVITNIGLTLQRSHSKIYVIARELDTGAPIPNATIEFLSRSGLRLERVTTDGKGMADISARLGRGVGGNKLVAVMAYREGGQDFAFLDMNSAAIDLADRGLDGNGRPGEYDAFIAPSRGVFRPGETVEALVLVRGPDGLAIIDLPPVEMTLVRSDGSILKKKELNRNNTDFTRDGGFVVKMEIPKSTAEGSLTLYAGIFGNRVGTATVDVHYFKPLTVRITQNKDWTGTVNDRGQLRLKGTARADYLYGQAAGGAGSGTDAPAADLRGELQVRVEPTQTPVAGCFEGFTFGRQVEEAKAQIFQGAVQPSGKDGQISVDFPQDGLLPSNVPTRASIMMTLLDASGRAAQGKFDVPLTQLGRRWLGVKAVEPTGPDSPTKFEFVLLDDKGQPVREPVWATVFQEQTDFVWSKDGTSWEYKPVPPARREIKSKFQPSVTRPSAAPQGACAAPATFEYRFDQSGRYLVELTDDKGTTTTQLIVGSGWTTAPDGSFKPDTLRVSAQKRGPFAPGEEIKINIETPHDAGKVLGEIVINGEVKHSFEADIRQEPNIKGGRASATVTVDRSWPAGTLHIYATSFRKSKDDSFQGGPGRAIGGIQVRIGEAGKRATVAIRPMQERLYSWQFHEGGGSLRIPIVAEGLSPNAWVALAVVDEGILSLTDFKTPDPYEHFFGRRPFDFDVFDNYGRILYARYGAAEPLEPVRGAGYQPDDIIVWHSGIHRLTDNRAELEIDTKNFPATFQGRLRLMAWVWDATSVAQAETQVIVRDPVIVRLSKPRFMAPGDAGVLPLRVANPNNPMIERLDVDVNVSGRLAFSEARAGATAGQPCGGGGSPTCRRFSLEARSGAPPTTALIPIRATADGAGTDGQIELSYRAGDRDMKKSWTVPVRAPYPHVVDIVPQQAIARGGRRDIRRNDLERIAAQKFNVDSLRLVARISRNDLMSPPAPSPSAEGEVHQLEQLVSLVQLLLISDGGPADGTSPPLADRSAVVERLNRLINDIAALQRSAGESAGGFDVSAKPSSDTNTPASQRKTASLEASAFALDVLTRAKAAGLDVDAALIDRTVGFLLSALKAITQSAEPRCSRPDLYALTVLARLNRIGPASFTGVADICAQAVGDDATKKLMLAAAYGAFGRAEAAQALLAAVRLPALPALASSPAEANRVGALLLESQLAQVDPAVVLTKIGFRAPARTENLVTSSWLARAVNAALSILDKRQRPFAPESAAITPADLIGRITGEGIELKRVDYAEFPPAGIQIVNRGDAPLQLSYVVEGVPLKVEDAHAAGFNIRLNRVGVDPGKATALKQFETAYYTVEVNQTDNYAGAQRLAVVQLLPTGFEGVETAYQDGWRNLIGDAINKTALSTQEYAEFQDDRWIALPQPGERRENHLLAFSVRPTFHGEFVLPPLMVRDLNNPQRIAWTKPQTVVVAPAD